MAGPRKDEMRTACSCLYYRLKDGVNEGRQGRSLRQNQQDAEDQEQNNDRRQPQFAVLAQQHPQFFE